MSDGALNLDTRTAFRHEMYNLVVDCFLSDTWTQALALASGILAKRHPDKAPHELLTLILVAGICEVIDEEHKTIRRRAEDFSGAEHVS